MGGTSCTGWDEPPAAAGVGFDVAARGALRGGGWRGTGALAAGWAAGAGGPAAGPAGSAFMMLTGGIEAAEGKS